MENKFYGRDSLETTDESQAVLRTTEKSYYALEYMGNLIRKDQIVQKFNECHKKWRRVSKSCFDCYMRYLKTNQQAAYYVANRER